MEVNEEGVASIEAILPTLCTKTEIEALRGEMHTGFSRMVAEMHREFAIQLRCMVTTILACAGLLFAGMKRFH